MTDWGQLALRVLQRHYAGQSVLLFGARHEPEDCAKDCAKERYFWLGRYEQPQDECIATPQGKAEDVIDHGATLA